MLTVQLIMQSVKPLVTKLPISATVYELKAELQSLLNIEPETLEISASDVTCADSDLLIEVAGLGKNKQIKPVVSWIRLVVVYPFAELFSHLLYRAVHVDSDPLACL
ncbi:uncharacterized protein LOC124461062 [Drosophila willistoni]|uniref:uncharacterized protein LOC124461062 n=1 Tax=Drosophila willistoni TaxID=7260 RepID=UPI001F079993|nr:uncharacterized protein LOC124461062 [Drosophila willistoni]